MELAEQPGRCAGSLCRTIHAPHVHTCTQGNMLSILLFLQHASHGRVHQLLAGNVWSPRRWERDTAHNTIDHNLSAPACAGCVFFFRLMCLRRHGQHVRERAGAQFMKSFIWSHWGGWGACTAGAVATPEKFKTACSQRSSGEHYRCVSFLKLLPSGQSISHIWACNSWKQ